jgi:hypothetical protein
MHDASSYDYLSFLSICCLHDCFSSRYSLDLKLRSRWKRAYLPCFLVTYHHLIDLLYAKLIKSRQDHVLKPRLRRFYLFSKCIMAAVVIMSSLRAILVTTS